MLPMRALFGLLGEAGTEWLADRAPRMGAALAYYITFALAPLMLLAIAIAGFVFGERAARGEILRQLEAWIGTDAAGLVQTMIINANQPATGWWATAVGIVVLFVGATGLFAELQDQLNSIWKVEVRPGRIFLNFLRERAMSFVMVLVIGVLLIASLVASTAVAIFIDQFENLHVAFLSRTASLSVSFAIILFLFALIYRALPDTKVTWRDVWLGATVASLLFLAGNYALGLYLVHSAVASAYGAAGSLAVLLMWLYYASQIFLYGAELTKVYARRYGSGRTDPDTQARPVSA
jgi:membrane protein